MQHFNYCNKMAKQFSRTLREKYLPDITKKVLSNALDLAAASEKFILPEGGRLFDDKEYKALDENEPLKLPYTFIALEYQHSEHTKINSESGRRSKRVLFCREREDEIVLGHASLGYVDSHRLYRATRRSMCADFHHGSSPALQDRKNDLKKREIG